MHEVDVRNTPNQSKRVREGAGGRAGGAHGCVRTTAEGGKKEGRRVRRVFRLDGSFARSPSSAAARLAVRKRGSASLGKTAAARGLAQDGDPAGSRESHPRPPARAPLTARLLLTSWGNSRERGD